MSYKSTHTGAQIDAGVSAALNPDTTVTPSSTNLVTSGAAAAAQAKATGDAIAAIGANLAPAFDSTVTYAIGDLVLYDGAVYRFTAAHTGAWDAGDVEQTTLGEEVMDIDTRLTHYAEIDGNYPEMTVGTAEQLESTVMTEDKAPYVFRASGGSANIGNREYDTLIGGTVAWNQLVNTGDTEVTVQSGHKYLSKINGVQTVAASTGSAIAINDSSADNVFDLTLAFGTTIANYIYSLEQATAGAGVAYFRKLFPKSYYPYNAGTLIHVNASAHKMVGFNQWDEEWELGTFDDSTGQEVDANNVIRCKNYIPVFPSTAYYIKGGVGRIYFYDANQNYISNQGDVANFGITTPADCHYMRFRLTTAYGTTYKNNVCINLSWFGTRNGEYEPYEAHTYALDSDLVLRGIPKLDASNNLYYDGDTYAADGMVTRKYGIVDLGTLEWTFIDTNYRYKKALISNPKRTPNNNITPSIISAKYRAGSITQAITARVDGAYISIDNTSDNVLIACEHSDFTPSGYLVYELATPTTEQADPFASPQIVDDWGTEEYVITEQSGVAMPVGHVTKYPQNLRDKLQHLPNLASADGDYIVRQSGTQMSLVPKTNELPFAPSEDGTYTLKCTVASGTASYSWVADA